MKLGMVLIVMSLMLSPFGFADSAPDAPATTNDSGSSGTGATESAPAPTTPTNESTRTTSSNDGGNNSAPAPPASNTESSSPSTGNTSAQSIDAAPAPQGPSGPGSSGRRIRDKEVTDPCPVNEPDCNQPNPCELNGDSNCPPKDPCPVEGTINCQPAPCAVGTIGCTPTNGQNTNPTICEGDNCEGPSTQSSTDDDDDGSSGPVPLFSFNPLWQGNNLSLSPPASGDGTNTPLTSAPTFVNTVEPNPTEIALGEAGIPRGSILPIANEVPNAGSPATGLLGFITNPVIGLGIVLVLAGLLLAYSQRRK
ncbi:MAG: hypothetical protein Q8P05_04720 [Candidatus Diapherotrites archaeon]|nr:hypothetical protein [Candidatus Diapherotrites archaeon]MDZ4256534.1 hypothetical protein [archaeon]